jgi:hypothetical protein
MNNLKPKLKMVRPVEHNRYLQRKDLTRYTGIMDKKKDSAWIVPLQVPGQQRHHSSRDTAEEEAHFFCLYPSDQRLGTNT